MGRYVCTFCSPTFLQTRTHVHLLTDLASLFSLTLTHTQTRELIDEEIGDFSCTNAVKPDIGPMIILIPCLAFVIPPLLLSILVLLCWKRRRRLDEKRGQRMEETVRGSSSEQGDETSWSV